MELARIPLFDRLAASRSVLIAGAGGGFDVFCGLPLAFALEAQGKRVHLANLSFSDLREVDERLSASVAVVDAFSDGDDRYFPEKHLCRYFAEAEHTPRPIYAIEKLGVAPVREGYETLIETLGVDALLLVDGGTDLLMRGDEAGLGTPVEDSTSLVATATLDVPTKLALCLGFGIDTYHGVCHAHFLENLAALVKADAYLGSFGLLGAMPEVRRYLDALAFVHGAMPRRPSIVNHSIASAIEGEFGDHHRTERTQGSELFINPLMSLYFAFELEPLADRLLYREQIEGTRTAFEVAARIEAFRHRVERRPRRVLPV